MKKIIEIKNQVLLKLNIKNTAFALGSLILLSTLIVLFGLPLIGVWACTAIIVAVLHSYILSKYEDVDTIIGICMVIVIAGFITGIVLQCDSYDDMKYHNSRKWYSDIVYNTGNYLDKRGDSLHIVTYRSSCDSVINHLQTSYNIANLSDYEDMYNERIILTGIVWNRNLTKVGSKAEPPKITTYNKLDGCLDVPEYIDTTIINNYTYTTLIATHMNRTFYLDTTAIIDYKRMRFIAMVNGEDTISGEVRIEKLDTEKSYTDTITVVHNSKNELCDSSKNCIISITAKTTTKPYTDKNKYLKRTITIYSYITNTNNNRTYNGIKFGDLDTMVYADTMYTNKSRELYNYELPKLFNNTKAMWSHSVKDYYYQVSFGYDKLDSTKHSYKSNAIDYKKATCFNKSTIAGKTIYTEYDACLKHSTVIRNYKLVNKPCGKSKITLNWGRGALASRPSQCKSNAKWNYALFN